MRFREQAFRRLVLPVVARHTKYTGAARNDLGLDLRAHHRNALRRGSDPDDAVPAAQVREFDLFGQETVSRMNRVGAMRECGLDDGVRPQIAARGFGGTDAMLCIGQRDMARVGIGLGKHGNGADAEATTRTDYPAGNFPAIGNEQRFDHRDISGMIHIR